MLQYFNSFANFRPQHPAANPPPSTQAMQSQSQSQPPNSPPRSPSSLPPSAPAPPPPQQQSHSPTATTHPFHPSHHAHSSSQSPPESIPPLTSPLRTTPIHPSLPHIKTSDPTHHPLHCRPLTQSELSSQKTLISTLKKQYPTPEAARKAKEEKAKEIVARMEENERKRGEIEKEERERVAQWEMERKVFGKYAVGRGRRDEDGGTDAGSGVGDKMEM